MIVPMGEWFTSLSAARQRVGLSQADLAARASVSLATVKAYEQGKRHPSRPYLIALMDAMKLEVMERNDLLEAAGYASDADEVVPSLGPLQFTKERAQEEIDRARWPAFVLNEMSEVVVANDAALALWGVSLADYPTVSDRSLLSFVSDPRFADRIGNWDEAVGTIASVFKGHFRGGEDLNDPSPVFRTMLEKFLAGDPGYVARFLKLWQEVEPAPFLMRWHYRVVWEEPGASRMEFDGVVSNCNEHEGWSFNDWVPVDAGTWEALSRVRSS
jgi:transcriptional regulator with XRE-family HTH domain